MPKRQESISKIDGHHYLKARDLANAATAHSTHGSTSARSSFMNFGSLPIGPSMLGGSSQHHFDNENGRRYSHRASTLSGFQPHQVDRPERNPERHRIPRKPSPLAPPSSDSAHELQVAEDFQTRPIVRPLSVDMDESESLDDGEDGGGHYKRSSGRKHSISSSIDVTFEDGRKQTLGLPMDRPTQQHSSIEVQQEDEETTKPATLKELFKFATKWNTFFNYLGLLAAIVSGVTQPLMTIVFGNLTSSFLAYTNAVMTGGDVQGAKESLQADINSDVLYLIYIGIGMFVTTYAYMAAWVYSGEEIAGRIRAAYLKAILRQDVAYFDKLGSGEVTTRLQSDIALIQEGISDKIPTSVMFLSIFVSGFVVAFVRNWKLALAMSSIVPCVLIAGVLMNILLTKATQEELGHVSTGASRAEESLSTVRTAKAFGIEAKLVELYSESNQAATKLGFKKAIINGIGMGVFFWVIYAGYALGFYYAAKLIAKGEMDSGVVMSVIFSVFTGAFSLALLAPNMQSLAFAQAAGGKVFETIDRAPLIDSSNEEGSRPLECIGEINVQNVSFVYPSRPDVPILSNFSLKIPAGQTTALVGGSGSGKSTIISLMERFYDPDLGFVTLDGKNLKDLNIKWLRTQIGLVSQEPTLFNFTIRQNIEHGLLNTQYDDLSAELKDRLVIWAAKQANAHDFIQKLPDKYETMVGDRGFLMSGGQKQRIAIARAVIKNPKILLLDEATSALDAASEGIVQQALDRASQGRTTIVIAHRLSTIKNAHNIVVMNKGKIVEQGSHERLLRIPGGAYASLISAQKISSKVESAEEESDEIDFEKEQIRLAQMKKRATLRASTYGASKRISVASFFPTPETENQDENEEKTPGLMVILWRLARFVPQWKLYIPGILGASAAGSVYPIFAILFGTAITNFSKCQQGKGNVCPEPFNSEMITEGNQNALWFFLISLGATIAILFQVVNFNLAANHLVERIRKEMLEAYLRSDVAFFDEDKNTSGNLTNSLADDTQKISGLIGGCLGTVIQSISTLMTGYVIALCYGWKLSLVVIAATPLTLSAGYIRLKLVLLKDAKIKKAHQGAAARAVEAAASIRTVASLTREESCIADYETSLKEPAKISHRTAFVGNILFSLSQSFMFGVIALAFWYGSKLLLDGTYESSAFFTILIAVVFGSIQAGNTFNFVEDVANASTAAHHAFQLMDSTPKIDSESKDGIILNNVRGEVRFENVHFRYPTRPDTKILRGLTLSIKAGSTVALVGGSGCGKSTSIQLLERFYDVLAGKITIDGHDIRDLNLKSFRKHVAIVSQEPVLYDGTVAFNLKLGNCDEGEEVTEEQMRKACRDANILEFVESLPQGFNTEVGGRGGQLSGGQKQRIAIARALIRDPSILLLDEATSALDSESEKVVQAAIDSAAKGRTVISIAHRLSTIQKSDKIFCLQDGKVAEQGDHRTLVNLKGIYAELVRLQSLQT